MPFGEIVGEVGGLLTGVDLLADRVAPLQVRVAERLDPEGPLADRVGPDLGVPGVGALRAGTHPHRRTLGTVRSAPHDPAPEGEDALAERGGGHGHPLAHHRLGREPPAGHHGEDVVDQEPSGHHLDHRQARTAAQALAPRLARRHSRHRSEVAGRHRGGLADDL